MDYQYLGQQVRRSRKALGFTQNHLAKIINVSASYIGHIERGSRKPSLETVVALCYALHTSIDMLVLPPESDLHAKNYPPKQISEAKKLLETALLMCTE